MATYTTITDAEIEPEKPVTTSLMNRLRDNPLAIAEGASGAPRIQQGAIDSGAVGQSQLKTAVGTVGLYNQSVGAGTSATSLATLTGGQYCFFPQWAKLEGSSNITASVYDVGTTSITGHATRFGFTLTAIPAAGDSDCSVEARARYIQSSPPYDHGDGAVFGYVYALVDAGGKVGAVYMAEDPPWYGNTRHSPQHQFVKDGRLYGVFRKPACRFADVLAGRATMKDLRARLGECETIVEEITSETKLRGMEDLPQPFQPGDGQTVALLDPMDALVGNLLSMMQSGESPALLLAKDYLRVDNTTLKRKGPPGVPIHAARWRP